MFLSEIGLTQNEKAFQIYNSKGKKVSYKKMKKFALQNEYVFFGEHHDNPICHWLQYEMMGDLYIEHGTSLRLGFEMFEQDQQFLLNDYITGRISDEQFKDSARLWPNYETDYRPLIQFAKEKNLFCLAANIPRRYASMLFKKGRSALNALSELEKSYMAPVDFPVDSTLSQYAALNSGDGHMVGRNMMEAQAIKDATMGQFLVRNRKEGQVFLHFNGAYHSDYDQGILWYVRQQQPEAKIMSISTVTQLDIRKLEKEHVGKANFIICIPESMTRTH